MRLNHITPGALSGLALIAGGGAAWGRGSGGLKPGRHIAYANDTPITNLYLTLLDRMGVEPETIGDSNGKLEHLAGI